MTRLSGFVRTAPKLFYVIAVVDLLGNLLPLEQYFARGTFGAINSEPEMRLTLFAGLLKAFVYAAQWVAYGIFAALLIGIHDRVALSHRDEAEPESVE
ncbi:MAG TPA: hypothetical protein VH331_04170 [Allosphingosinicella sp.]|jgi:hypothetical protein|nr:hypothetical protein [Allosphingosinicella sp.]